MSGALSLEQQYEGAAAVRPVGVEEGDAVAVARRSRLLLLGYASAEDETRYADH